MLKKALRNYRFGIVIFCIVFLSIFVSSLSWSHTWVTVCGGRSVIHNHPPDGFSYQEKLYWQNYIRTLYPCIVKYFDLPTYSYNCHGWAYNTIGTGIPCEGLGWYIVNVVWPDDFVTVGLPYQIGDRVAYYNGGTLTHSGVVVGVSAGGGITMIDSKWGQYGLYRHPPACILSGYGSIGLVKRFTNCTLASNNYEYSPDELNPIIMDEEKFTELIGGDPNDEFGKAKRAEQVDKWLESYRKGEIDLNQVINQLTSGFENPISMNTAEFLFASEPAVAKIFFQSMPEIQGLIALGDQVIKPLTDKINDENLENKFVAVPAYNYVLEVLKEEIKD